LATQRQQVIDFISKFPDLADSETVSILTAVPPDLEWGGLVISGRAGLEVGLIESFYLPWNVRGTI
jgi:hypothetical protein